MHLIYNLARIILILLLLCGCRPNILYNYSISTPWQILSPNAPALNIYVAFDGLAHRGGDAESSYLLKRTGDNDRWRINRLKQKIASAPPSKKIKYKQQLQQYTTALQNQFEKNTNDRMLFLQKFYSDLYKLTNKEFTKKYRKYCSRSILDEAKFKYRIHHGEKGYAWNIFTDNEMHIASDFHITYLDGNPDNIADKKDALFMFGDSVKHKEPEYRYTNHEDKWFQVRIGSHYVMVQIYGTFNDMLITGVVNPYANSFVKGKINGIRHVTSSGYCSGFIGGM